MMIVLGVLAALVLALAVFIAATWAPERKVAELKGRWAPPPSVFVAVLGMQVHLRDEGPRDDESPIVLLHGSGSSLHAWEGWAQALKSPRRVIRYDMAGFGLTGPSPDGVYTADSDVRLVIAVLDTLGIARCVLGGNSLGGAVAWRTALTHPSRVDKLILVDAGGYPYRAPATPLGFRLVRMPGLNWLLQHTLPRFLVEQGLRSVFADPKKVTPDMVDRAVALTQREGNRRAFIARATQRPSANLADRIPELKLPTLITWGGRDRLIPPEIAERFHRDIAGSTLAMFDDLGHAPDEEDPERTVVAVQEFL
ncbi:MAG TPA: alpha/beta hydrolase, partial [Xanthobacteraceae bacterium]|nr:alpha/beta hydrolase [Xanthobacteraceae bacterium]